MFKNLICRAKRNKVEYSYASATISEADELIQFDIELRKTIQTWLRKIIPNWFLLNLSADPYNDVINLFDYFRAKLPVKTVL